MRIWAAKFVINAIARFSCTCSTCLLLGEHLRQEEDVRSELMKQHHLLQVRKWDKGDSYSNVAYKCRGRRIQLGC